MTREHLLNFRHLAMDDYTFQQVMVTPPMVNVNVGEIKEPKIEFIAGTNNYSPVELSWLGIGTDQQKSGLIAMIPVRGSLSPFWTYGGTNTEWLSRQIDICLGNDAVSSIVLNIMSGGGTVSGTLAAADTIAKANQQKPVLTYVSGLAASAAYWLASQSSEIFLESPTSTAVGSIGVMAVYVSEAQKNQQEGYDYRVLRSKGGEDKYLFHPAEPINEEAMKEEQAVLDAMRVEFLSSVQKNRPQLASDPGAKLFYGKEAVRKGLADSIGSLSDTVKRADYLARKRNSPST